MPHEMLVYPERIRQNFLRYSFLNQLIPIHETLPFEVVPL
jgi:hypothetical protein